MSSHMNWFNQNYAYSVFRTVDVSVLWVLHVSISSVQKNKDYIHTVMC